MTKGMPTSRITSLGDSASDRAWQAAFDEMRAADTKPTVFTQQNTPRNREVFLLTVLHHAGPNSVQISTDGDPANAKWVPLFSRQGKSIAKLIHTEVDRSADRPGIQIYRIPGWLAVDRGFAQARRPELSDACTWTVEQRQAWSEARKRWERAAGLVPKQLMPTRNSVA
ncbi:hypothetical protein OOZ54_12530 [Rhodopseudomonas palustris]|uniref:hypothetical protein n=1 Tax=Rhodopseudomonas palustris TaxID=1076 RepID=UPI0022F105D9|nr:hypothetical protein [Rhodopseudomonas palustris]WBU27520.1 hypothetical protein OOZ54_12530 [Rhodopseudomonas palustris]